MEIGGYDLVIPSRFSVEDSAEIVRGLLEQYWPDAVYEEADGLTADFFMYENATAKEYWDQDMPEGDAPMIYALFDWDVVTLVHDGPGTNSGAVAHKVSHSIDWGIGNKNGAWEEV